MHDAPTDEAEIGLAVGATVIDGHDRVATAAVRGPVRRVDGRGEHLVQRLPQSVKKSRRHRAGLRAGAGKGVRLIRLAPAFVAGHADDRGCEAARLAERAVVAVRCATTARTLAVSTMPQLGVVPLLARHARRSALLAHSDGSEGTNFRFVADFASDFFTRPRFVRAAIDRGSRPSFKSPTVWISSVVVIFPMLGLRQ